MDELLFARLQFGITTVYHYLFVPVTIGLSLLVAILQSAWLRTGKEHYLRATKFYGRLFLINFAMGLVTGIVQEFQFGMNWSAYSRYVGDIFGAPLAMEALIAFFLESTFLGIWMFGWDRLPRPLHLATIWAVAIGTMLSAYFILAANSWMQHPVGARYDAAQRRAVLADFSDVLTNKVLIWTFPHTVFGAWLTGGVLMAAVAAWHLLRRRNLEVFRPALRLGMAFVAVSFALLLVSGDPLGKAMTQAQPMKMAAAEALYETERPAAFSVFTVGTLDGSEPVFQLRIPRLLSFLATGSFDGRVEGINQLNAEYQKKYGPGDYRPVIPVAYWCFRIMIGAGGLAFLVALAAIWLTRRGRLPGRAWTYWTAIAGVALPFIANSAGWIFTEMARQPWVVFGMLRTGHGVSPSVGAGTVLATVILYTALYGALAVVEVGLMLRYAKVDPPAGGEGGDEGGEGGRRVAVAY